MARDLFLSAPVAVVVIVLGALAWAVARHAAAFATAVAVLPVGAHVVPVGGIERVDQFLRCLSKFHLTTLRGIMLPNAAR